jgi:hypothetical protein
MAAIKKFFDTLDFKLDYTSNVSEKEFIEYIVINTVRKLSLISSRKIAEQCSKVTNLFEAKDAAVAVAANAAYAAYATNAAVDAANAANAAATYAANTTDAAIYADYAAINADYAAINAARSINEILKLKPESKELIIQMILTGLKQDVKIKSFTEFKKCIKPNKESQLEYIGKLIDDSFNSSTYPIIFNYGEDILDSVSEELKSFGWKLTGDNRLYKLEQL